jgi:hypothetical protein
VSACRGLLALGAALLTLAAPAAAAEPGRHIDYLYIEANEGGSSGGHVALGLGDEVFHFEHRSPGILVLGLDDLEHFRYRYGVRENRTIHVSRIPVSEETYMLLVERFRRRHFLQTRHLDVMDGLARDRATLEEMRAGVLAIEAAGFFAAPETPDADPDLVTLRSRVQAAYGADVLDGRIEGLRARLQALDPAVLDLPEPPAAELPPVPTYSFPRRYRDLVTTLAAMEILRDARPLAPGALLPSLDFTDADAAATGHLAEALSGALVRLVASERPDAGGALLVGMARLVALAESVRQGRWLVVDAFPAAAATVGRRPEGEAELAESIAAETARRRERLLSRSGEGELREVEFAAFEAAANRLAELHLARAEGRERRILGASLVPSRPGRRVIGELDGAALSRALEAVEERQEAYAAAFKRRWGYNLVTRNCVSEIFSEIDAAFPGGAEGSLARLGGRIEMDGSLNFIPAVSAASVASAYPVTEHLELPSYRTWRKEQMYERENPVAVFLRESNTLTSAMYRHNPDDSIFVFFTDDAVLARPLLGAVNLAVGLAASAVGILTWPADGGATLRAGLKGAVFSLPELFFQNIRKGSFGYLKRDGRPDPNLRPGGG